MRQWSRGVLGADTSRGPRASSTRTNIVDRCRGRAESWSSCVGQVVGWVGSVVDVAVEGVEGFVDGVGEENTD